jgi:hypothetical protein
MRFIRILSMRLAGTQRVLIQMLNKNMPSCGYTDMNTQICEYSDMQTLLKSKKRMDPCQRH